MPIKKVARNTDSIDGSPLRSVAIPGAIVATPVIRRNSRSPIPGGPRAKVENSRRTVARG
jgi:hypothetical protein